MTGKKVAAEGTVLLQLRRKAGWTQARLERTARLSRGVISLYETGRRPLNRHLLGRLAGTLGLALEDVDRASPELAKAAPNFDAPQALTPASLLPHEQRAVEAAAERAAARVRLGVGTRLIEARLRSERNEAANIWDELRKLPSLRAWRERINTDQRYSSWALCERLCNESVAAAPRNLSTSLSLARLALKVSENIRGSAPWRCKVQGFAWAFVGNSLRVAGDFQSADAAFLRSDELWMAEGAGGLAPLDGSQILSFKACLRRYQGRFAETRVLLNAAMQEADILSKRVSLQLHLALLIGSQGNNEGALETLEAIAPLVTEAKELRLHYIFTHSCALFHFRLGQFKQASMLLGPEKRLALDLGNELDSIRTRWLSAKITAELGSKKEAISQIKEVRQAFLRKGMELDAKLAALDLQGYRSGP